MAAQKTQYPMVVGSNNPNSMQKIVSVRRTRRKPDQALLDNKSTVDKSGGALTGRQDWPNAHLMGGKAYASGEALIVGGGTWGNPGQFPGYGRLYRRSYWTYRWILQHPIIRLVRAIAIAPIVASSWAIRKGVGRDTVSDEWIKTIDMMVQPLRRRYIEDALRARDYGWAPFEPVWEYRDGLYWLTDMKPLAHDVTTIVTDESGYFAGLSQTTMASGAYQGYSLTIEPNNPVPLPAPYHGHIHTYDREIGNLYGRSWLENCRETCWKDWLDTAQQLNRLGAKITGIVTIIKSPSGSIPDGRGGKTNYKDNAEAIIDALAKGSAGAWVPSMAMLVDPKGNVDLMKLFIELSKASLTSIETLDFGNQSAAITGLLDRMKHNEELMFAAGLKPSRAGLETRYGTKADASVATDTGVLTAELDNSDIADQFQAQVDAIGTLNFAGYRPGDAVAVAIPLVDTKRQVHQAVLDTLMADPQLAPIMGAFLGLQQMFDSINVPITDAKGLTAALIALKDKALAAPATGTTTDNTKTTKIPNPNPSGSNGG